MISSFKASIAGHLQNSQGWRTKRRIVVIESDDWGSIRMASRESYDFFLRLGVPVDRCCYSMNDGLESNDDLQELMRTLRAVRDKNGNPCIFTINHVAGNPDFKRIRDCDFQQYWFEPFEKTLQKYPRHNEVLDLYHLGMKENLFRLQFHGREHINVRNWLAALQSKDSFILRVFEHEMFTIFRGTESSCRSEYLDAFGACTASDLSHLRRVINEGCSAFASTWNYSPTSVIAPCYIWAKETEKYFKENGLIHIQSSRVQKVPTTETLKYYHIRRFTGERNDIGQVYTVRNAYFEPSQDPKHDWITSCLNEISAAFFWKKPAIISSHRVNYIGFINEENRIRNNKLLKQLLSRILTIWPDVEFMASDTLASEIAKDIEPGKL